MQELCTIRWSGLDAQKLRSLKQLGPNADGNVHYIIEFEIEMTPRGKALEFAVVFEGSRVAKENVNVDYAS